MPDLPTVAVEDVDPWAFARAVGELIAEWHRQPHEWIPVCTCGEPLPCRSKDAYLAGLKSMFAAIRERDRLRALWDGADVEWEVRYGDDNTVSGAVLGDREDAEQLARRRPGRDPRVVSRRISGWSED